MSSQLFQPLQGSDLLLMTPELTLVIAVIVMSIVDLLLPRRVNRSWIGGISLTAVLLSLGSVIWTLVDRYQDASAGHKVGVVELLGGSYRIDDFGLLIKVVLLIGTALVIGMSIDHIRESEIQHRGEYYYLLLPAVLGGLILASSADLITLFVGLELLSISSYLLVAIRKRDRRSTEGAFKYIVLGSTASAFILYGMSFLYGMTGTTHLGQIAERLAQNAGQLLPLLYISLLLLLVGFGFKIAAAPFHAWSPDVYEGAPTPIAAFLSVVSKGAVLALLFRLVFHILFGFHSVIGFGDPSSAGAILNEDMSLILLSIAAFSMIVGTTMALRQVKVKRLLALSGVANAGYLLVPVGLNIFQPTVWYSSSFSSFWYYLIAYVFTTIGAFAILAIVSKGAGHEELKCFAGLYYKAPWLAVAMTIFVLSLAGIPITAGFFGKLYILLGAVATHTLWLAIVMMVTSVISFYVYFGFIRQMFMRNSESGSYSQTVQVHGTESEVSKGQVESANLERIHVSVASGAVVALSAAAVILLAIFPNELMTWVNTLLSLANDIYAASYSKV
ncbi:NADH-quinone oxidoreductase subunit N [Paenibacillus sp. SC116]|uniref:NADH-quinone oxidoreductase subunit N n=1 Tax=Paenibacillus sp. SC116 TaxID=2968986 RepID=UPI00215A217A|nr:NADH-quinone oxidoreductase subunit N [Paenibacillus sp. SC116]MCR8844766.1 NADH-quinone oxidoreductase subunit N [Paenibacillus sp. SC116]